MTQKERETILTWSDGIMRRQKELAQILEELFSLYFEHGGSTSMRQPTCNDALKYLLTSEAKGVFEKALILYNRYIGIQAQINAVEHFGWEMANSTGKPWQIEKEPTQR